MMNTLRNEYTKSGMNIFSFLYWTVRANIDDRRIARARAKRAA